MKIKFLRGAKKEPEPTLPGRAKEILARAAAKKLEPKTVQDAWQGNDKGIPPRIRKDGLRR
jgi:hypothetical protein